MERREFMAKLAPLTILPAATLAKEDGKKWTVAPLTNEFTTFWKELRRHPAILEISSHVIADMIGMPVSGGMHYDFERDVLMIKCHSLTFPRKVEGEPCIRLNAIVVDNEKLQQALKLFKEAIHVSI